MSIKDLKYLLVKKDSNYQYEDLDFVIGDCGSGKSTYASKLAQKYLKKGYPVYSTTFIRGCRILKIDDLMSYDLEENAVVILDEATSQGLGTRGNTYKKNSTGNVNEFFTMCRHYKVRKIIVISPSFQDVLPVIRSRVKYVSVCKLPLIFSTLLLPFNILLVLFKFYPIKITLVKFVGKKIIIPKNDTGASEPIESFQWIPLKRKYFIQNLYRPFFDSFCQKSLLKNHWEVYE